MSETTCLVFYPDELQFQDFRAYVEGIERNHPGIGICKIVPPKSWYVQEYKMEELEKQIIVKQPIKQIVSGRGGIYQLELLELSNMSLSQFKRYCDSYQPESNHYPDREKRFWSSLGFSSGVGFDPLYGADIVGTLFTGDESHSEWNLNYLENLLRLLDKEKDDNDEDDGNEDDELRDDGEESEWDASNRYRNRHSKGRTESRHNNASISSKRRKLKNNNEQSASELIGITKPMLYIGSWRSMFAFHVEDMDLYSINYLHLGAEKSWYAIPPHARKRFEVFAESVFEGDRRECPEFLRHKTKIFSPSKLHSQSIPFETVLQRPGEFVISFPGAYHAGFNHGFNIAEAVNFAFRRWVDMGLKAKRCLCQPHTVNIDVNQLETLYLRKRLDYRRQDSFFEKRGYWRGGNNFCSGSGSGSGSGNGKDYCLTVRDIFRCKSRRIEKSAFYFMEEILDDSVDYFDEYDGRIRCFCSMKNISQTWKPSFRGERVESSNNSSIHHRSNRNVDLNTITNSGPTTEAVETREHDQCQGCSLWFHPDCVRDAYTSAYDTSFVDIPLCHHCYSIESQIAGVGPIAGLQPTPSAPPSSATTLTIKSSSSAKTNRKKTLTVQSNSMKPAHAPVHRLIQLAFQMANSKQPTSSAHTSISEHVKDSTNKNNVKSKKSKNERDEVGKGSTVSVKLPGALVETVGRITDVDSIGQFGRLHVKGTKRTFDAWVLLDDCKLFIEAQEEGQASNQDAIAKQARIQRARAKRLLRNQQKQLEQMQTTEHRSLQYGTTHIEEEDDDDYFSIDVHADGCLNSNNYDSQVISAFVSDKIPCPSSFNNLNKGNRPSLAGASNNENNQSVCQNQSESHPFLSDATDKLVSMSESGFGPNDDLDNEDHNGFDANGSDVDIVVLESKT